MLAVDLVEDAVGDEYTDDGQVVVELTGVRVLDVEASARVVTHTGE